MSQLYIDFYQNVSFLETKKEYQTISKIFTPKSFRSRLLRDFDPNYSLLESCKDSIFRTRFSEIENFITDLANIGFEFEKVYFERTVSLIRNHHPSTSRLGPFLEFVILCREVLGKFNSNCFKDNHTLRVYRGDLDADYNLKIYQDFQTFQPIISELTRSSQEIYLKLLNGFEFASQNGLTIFTFYQYK